MKPQRGNVNEGVFRNTYFKIAIPINEGDYVWDDRGNYEQVKNGGMPVTDADWELADGVLTFEEMEKVFKGRNREFALLGADSKYSIVVQYDNMDIVYGTHHTVDQYVEVFRNQHRQADPEAEIAEVETICLGWSDYKRLTILSRGYQYNYYFRAQDNYMVSVVYARFDGYLSGRDEFELSIPL